nr:hypothetical protein Iba_chr11cCG7100 [Ipomoea batatas]GMD55270.1 hypothetical protein Iba_chr11dCG6310 [Ipomoea batatas]GMD58628.1 hypothetical protein Iba_chr11fCG7380 [Ipomoea batatas]
MNSQICLSVGNLIPLTVKGAHELLDSVNLRVISAIRVFGFGFLVQVGLLLKPTRLELSGARAGSLAVARLVGAAVVAAERGLDSVHSGADFDRSLPNRSGGQVAESAAVANQQLREVQPRRWPAEVSRSSSSLNNTARQLPLPSPSSRPSNSYFCAVNLRIYVD